MKCSRENYDEEEWTTPERWGMVMEMMMMMETEEVMVGMGEGRDDMEDMTVAAAAGVLRPEEVVG